MSFLSRQTCFQEGTGAVKRPPAMFFLVALAFVYLIRFDLFLAAGNFATLHKVIRQFPTFGMESTGMAERLCKAVDLAAIVYWKRVLCLQRSAATACLLRRFGIPAQMVVGTRHLPFKAHAWVEVHGRVVNDRPYVCEIYAVLDRW